MTATLLAVDKLRSSGLDMVGLLPLHMVALTAEQTAAIGPNFALCPSLRINYMDPYVERAPGQAIRHRPMAPAFFRVRYLGPNIPKAKNGKEIRYMQPSGIGVCAYFPPILDWPTILADPTYELIITEGELKAAKSCAMGFPTIGLGGVNNFVAHTTGYDLLPELQRINWVMRKVTIIFDNDGRANPDIVLALNKLAGRMEALGAIPYTACLPDPPQGGKMGLDDYFITHTAQEFVTLMERREAMTMALELWKMNERFVKVCDPMSIVDLSNMRVLQLAGFKAHYDNIKVPKQEIGKDGVMSYAEVPLATKWLGWKLRTSVDGITYAPGQKLFMEDTHELNTWTGWGSTPKKGNVQPFLDLLSYVFGPTKEGKFAQKWFLQWAAYPIQHPGAKLLSAVVIWSNEQGVGKSFLAYFLGAVYGQSNWREVGQKDLVGSFSSWVKNKQLIIGNEITGSDNREVVDQLKALITSPRVSVNEKYIPEYELPNVCNFMFNSNRPSAVFIEQADRRFFIWEVQQKAPKAFFDALDVWKDAPANISAVHHYLLNVDLAGFSPTAAPPMTTAKEDMIEAGQSSHANWCHRLLATPDYFLRIGNAPLTSDLYTSAELLNLFRQGDQMSSLKATGLAIELRIAGFKQLPQLRWGNPERQDRFFVIRNPEKWLKATPIQIRKHLEQTKQQTSPLAAQYKGVS